LLSGLLEDWIGRISYFEAWGDWFAGQQVDPQYQLWFLNILWWGRLGKIAAFLGGLTVILDLVGPERLRRWGRESGTWKESLQRPTSITLSFGVAVATGAALRSLGVSGWIAIPILVVISFPSVLVVKRIVKFLIRGLADALNKESPARGIRIFAAILIGVGFHFDLLGP